jgi:hypothetical protein
LPKTATTRQKTETKNVPTPGNDGSNGAGGNKTTSKNSPEMDKHVTDEIDVKQAHAEYLKRKKTQQALIKKTDKELLREMLYQMVLGRVFEQKCAEVYRIGKIGGFCHLYIGQEAISIGTQMCLKEGDYVITSLRQSGRQRQRQGRLDAYVLEGEKFLRRARHRWRTDRRRNRNGLRAEISRN